VERSRSTYRRPSAAVSVEPPARAGGGRAARGRHAERCHFRCERFAKSGSVKGRPGALPVPTGERQHLTIGQQLPHVDELAALPSRKRDFRHGYPPSGHTYRGFSLLVAVAHLPTVRSQPGTRRRAPGDVFRVDTSAELSRLARRRGHVEAVAPPPDCPISSLERSESPESTERRAWGSLNIEGHSPPFTGPTRCSGGSGTYQVPPRWPRSSAPLDRDRGDDGVRGSRAHRRRGGRPACSRTVTKGGSTSRPALRSLDGRRPPSVLPAQARHTVC